MDTKNSYLEGQVLIAMPTMQDPRFEKSVIYLCSHSADGAMGLIVNKPLTDMTFPDLLEQIGISPSDRSRDIRVQFGGPVETERGFVMHSSDYRHEGTVALSEDLSLTATVDILKDIAEGGGPRQALITLGYAGWAPGQLEAEIQANGWLHAPAAPGLIFSDGGEEKWHQALASIGIDPSTISGDAGHA